MTFRRCYMCELEGTTLEHVPPKAIFPESKDADGEHYRIDLITVPSCELHNTGKSQDDEFLMVCIAGIIGNNSIGYRHKFTKVDRALARTSYKLLSEVFLKAPESKRLDLGDNRFIDVLKGTPDKARLLICFDRIIRGIYYHHFKSPFSGKVTPLLAFLTSNDQSSKNLQQFLIDRATIDLAEKPRFGKNQGVFYYQIIPADEHGISLIHLCFYGGVNIYTALIPKTSTIPFSLANELRKSGEKTLYSLGDKTYEVN